MRVVRARELGMCFGVRDALKAAQQVSDPDRVTIHGELVHNPHVNRQLSEAGFHQSPEHDRLRANTPVVLITAHGISNAERKRLQAADKELIDTTCPLVRRVHEAAVELQSEGRHVLLIGKAGHVEVQGIIEDLDSYNVIERVDQVSQYPYRQLGVVCQSTMPSDLVMEVYASVKRLNPQADIRFVDTVCNPTKRRQLAMFDLLGHVDAVVVVGGRNSNNTRRLLQLCIENETPAVHVECADELDPEWFHGIETVGLTAGTSTLDQTIDAVHRALEKIALNRKHEGDK